MPVRNFLHSSDIADKSGDDDIRSDDASNANSSHSSLSTDAAALASTAHSGSRTEEEEESRQKLNLARKENAAVFRLRLLVFVVLLLAALGVSVIVYLITARSEEDEYRTQYEGIAKKITESFLDIAESKMGVISALGLATVAHGVDHGRDWPFVTLTWFQQRASTARKQSGAMLLTINPVVEMQQREEWEQFVAGEDSYWIQEGLDYQDEIGMFEFASKEFRDNHSGASQIEHDEIISNERDGHGRHRKLEENNDNPQGGHIHDFESVIEEDRWAIWHYNENHEVEVDLSRGPYMPTWESSPIFFKGHGTNENALGPFTNDNPYLAYNTSSVVVSDFKMAPPGNYNSGNHETALYSGLMSVKRQQEMYYHGDPLSDIYFPIFNSFKPDRRPVAVLIATIQWRHYFANILPSNLRGIQVVLKNSCGGQYTYELNGANAVPVGIGDLHDTQFDDMIRSSSFEAIANIDDGTKYGIPFNKDHCSVSIDIYPTLTFYDLYNTGTPIIMTVSVAIIFVFTALMFLFYDRLVERRQKIVMRKAEQTTAIVTSLFPEQVRERLMAQATKQVEKANAKGGEDFLAPNRRLKGFLNGIEDDDEDDAPIADLFPYCTVLFADIAGFTAWSSSREPAQVFILLQAVYQAFDKVAKRRKVFKVETIGDSYVAVTGLPEPQSQHAIIMARFAQECRTKMKEVTSMLENKLGPDTGDLCMRFGLHSGPVTAGVLRGDRARFQLFGDTVNTAARMESTGQRGKIHVSLNTHDLLVEAGKAHWLKPRADAVHAKGKGNLKTFWLDPSSKKGSNGGSSNTDPSESRTSLNNEEAAAFASRPALSPAVVSKKDHQSTMKQDRLVNWIVDMLHEHIRKLVALRKTHSTDHAVPFERDDRKVPLDEVAEVIYLPRFDGVASSNAQDYRAVHIDPEVMTQLKELVATIASWYRENPFHNFEHACHVTMATNKFLKRIVAPDIAVGEAKQGDIASQIHNYTHGINSDPLTILAIVFSALIHDVDHQGVSNLQLITENKDMGDKYKNKSVAEQNSLDLAWELLMQDKFIKLRNCLFTTEAELKRFRQVIVNVVLATDIFDPELNGLRKQRWEKAFSGDQGLSEEEENDLRATIVIEHIIQASDVSHPMQHWHVYRKWNKRLFQELHLAFRQGRMGKDPSEFWYNGELGFFDNYIIPLAKKLKECNVFGVSSDECLNYALQNREEWKEKGQQIVDEMMKELAPTIEAHKKRSSLRVVNEEEAKECAK